MENNYFLGIDPGKDGAMVVLDSDMNVELQVVVPTIGESMNYDKTSIINILKSYNIKFAVLEDPGVIFGISKSANASLSRCVGMYEGILHSLGIPYTTAKPTQWQPKAWGTTPRQYKSSSSGSKISDPKANTLLAVNNYYPGIDLRKSPRSTKPHDGIADAILIARFAKMSFEGT